MISKKELAIKLSKLEVLKDKKISLEQYDTDSEVASEILWWAYLSRAIKGKVVADFGCGNGILGYGCLLLGAKKVYFVDIDEDMLKLTKKNVKSKKASFILSEITEFNKKIDTVIMNPPFGVQKRKADKKFLEKAMELSNEIFSLHKVESEKFISKISEENSFEVIGTLDINLVLKKSYAFHKKERYSVCIGCWHLKRKCF